MITLDRKQLGNELALLSAVAEKKTTMPILSTIKFEFSEGVLTLTGTDIDMTIITELEASGDPWSGCIPSRQLREMVRLFNGEKVELTPKPNDRIQVKCGQSKHLLPVSPATDFPNTERASVDLVMLNGPALGLSITRALRCVSADAKEHWMQGISLCSRDGVLLVTGTNSRHLATTSITTDLSVDLILPTRAAIALTKFLEGEAEVGANENLVIFRQGSRMFTARLLDAKFPDWRPLVPASFKHSISLDSETAGGAFRLASVTAKETALIALPLKLTISGSEMIVETRESEIGQSTEVLPIECPTLNGSKVSTGVNGAHFISFIEAETKPRLAFNDDLKILQLSVEGEPDYRYITMALKA